MRVMRVPRCGTAKIRHTLGKIICHMSHNRDVAPWLKSLPGSVCHLALRLSYYNTDVRGPVSKFVVRYNRVSDTYANKYFVDIEKSPNIEQCNVATITSLQRDVNSANSNCSSSFLPHPRSSLLMRSWEWRVYKLVILGMEIHSEKHYIKCFWFLVFPCSFSV